MYTSPSHHWRRSGCEYPTPTARQHEIITGSILGDGTIYQPSNGNAWYAVDNTQEDYLQWLDNQLGVFTNGVKLVKTSSELAESRSGSAEDYSNIYRIQSKRVPYFSDLYEKWYPAGNKMIPQEFSLSPLKLTLWYVDDGNVRYLDKDTHTPLPKISINNWMSKKNMVESLFKEIGLNPTIRGHKLHICADESDDFFEYIQCGVPGFPYKFPKQDFGCRSGLAPAIRDE